MYYNLLIFLYGLAIRVAALFNDKAKQWVTGRVNWEQRLKAAIEPGKPYIWIHCASLGEFEQGRPLIEALKKEYPNYKIVLSFFSPSGYEAQKNYAMADVIVYLPMDGKRNAAAFISTIQPKLAIFVKYEFWYHYLHELKKQEVPTVLVSGAFRQSQPFFKWYGGMFKKMLGYFSFFFVQDKASAELLKSVGYVNNVLVSGDTRYDRVAAIAEKIQVIPAVEQFKGNNKILIAGSTWPRDEAVLHDAMSALPDDWKLIIAPHEVDAGHIEKIVGLFGKEAVLFSQLKSDASQSGKKILVIDNIGMLSSLYAYGTVAYIGGGFDSGGIHNILEPAVFGLPVIFGPIFDKFVEAKTMVGQQYAFPVRDASEYKQKLGELINDNNKLMALNTSIKAYMKHNTGATNIIISQVSREKWLQR